MNWGHFKYSLCYLYLVGSVVTPWSLTQEVAGSNDHFHKKIVSEVNENISGRRKGKDGIISMVHIRNISYSGAQNDFFNIQTKKKNFHCTSFLFNPA